MTAYIARQQKSLGTADTYAIQPMTKYVIYKNANVTVDTEHDITTVECTGGEGGKGGIWEYDVKLYDYDGTLIRGYSAEDFLELEEYPEVSNKEAIADIRPTLIFQNFNWDLQTAKTYVEQNRKLNIGAIYTATNYGACYHFKFIGKPDKEVPDYPYQLYFTFTPYSESGEIEIDWGDDSTIERYQINGYVSVYHSYPSNFTQDFLISIKVLSGDISIYPYNSQYGGNVVNTPLWANCLKGCYFGEGVKQLYGSIHFYNTIDCEISLSNDIQDIQRAFNNATGIKHINIPNTITSLLASGFYRASIETISLPSTIQSLDTGCFANSNLKEITLPNIITTIPTACFYETKLQNELIIPEGITTISSVAFGDCSGFTKLSLPSSLNTVDNSSFVGCTSLTQADIKSIGQSIPNSCFINNRLGYIKIPEGVTKIYTNAFMTSTFHTSVIDLPSTIQEIEDYAFGTGQSSSSHPNFSYVICRATTPPTATQNWCSSSTGLTNDMYVPEDSVALYRSSTFGQHFNIRPLADNA